MSTRAVEPVRLLVTTQQFGLLRIVAAEHDLDVMEFVRIKFGEKFVEVVVSDDLSSAKTMIGVRQQLDSGDAQRTCSQCGHDVFIHDKDAPDIPIVCTVCADMPA